MKDIINEAKMDSLEETKVEDSERIEIEGEDKTPNISESKTENFTEEGIQLNYYVLNDFLADCPITYTETELLQNQFNKLCYNLTMKNCNSTIIVGEDGHGKTSLVYYFTEMLNQRKMPISDLESLILEFDALEFPNCTIDIINSLIALVLNFVKNGNNNIILFFDEFQRFSPSFWSDYSVILDRVVNAFDENVTIKFLLSIESDYLDANENQAKELVNESLVFLISQEVVPEEIISVLAPRISELMELHSIRDIEYEVLQLIYGMELASTSQTVLPYEIYLTYLDKIMSEYECKKQTYISYTDICEYYKSREYKSDFFKTKKDKLKVARHEAGHTLIALLLEEFIYINSVTILGITSCGYSGLTMIFTNSDVYWQTKKNFKKFLAFYLAGRYSEGSMDKGAMSDLDKANTIARNYICTSGLYKELGKDFYCSLETSYKLTSEKQAIIEALTVKVMKKARKYAKKQLKKHKKFVDVLTKKLYKEYYVTREDILKLWSEFK